MSSEFIADSAVSYNSDHRSAGRYIWLHVRRHWWVLVLLIIGAFSNAALASAVPFYVGQAFNEIQRFTQGQIAEQEALNFALLMVLAIIGSQALRAALQLMRNFSSETFAQRIERDVRDELYASLLGKSMTFHDMQPVGDIMARVTNDVRELNFMMNPGFNLVIGSGWFLILPLVVSPLIHPHLVLTPLLFVIGHLFVQYRLVRDVSPIAQQVRISFGRMNSRLAEALEGLQVVKGGAQEENEIKRFTTLAETVRDHYVHQGRVEARYLSFLLQGLAFVGALVHSILLYQAGQIQIGDIVTYIGQIYLFGFPVFTSLFALSRIASGFASAQRILDIIRC